jgi:non-ribosomal peptide synthase protein (TIGR01720 family)
VQSFEEPRTPAEKILANIWKQVLGVDLISVYDNFLDLGGDSLLSMRVVDLAKQSGFQLAPHTLLTNPTLADLATTWSAINTPDSPTQPEIVRGPTPLSMGQYDFFADANYIDRQRWNISILFESQPSIPAEFGPPIARELLQHHDALRMRFSLQQGSWHASIAEPDETAPFISFDFSALPEGKRPAVIEQAAEELQSGLHLSAGPLIWLAFFNLGESQPGRLMLVVHHLVSDTVSLTILLEDIQTAYHQLRCGDPIRLPPKTTSVKYWGEHFNAYYSRHETLLLEWNYWRRLLSVPVLSLPADHPRGRVQNTNASTNSLTSTLTSTETFFLLRELPKIYKTTAREALLMALVQTITQWSGTEWVTIKVPLSLRKLAFPEAGDIDLSRTVGNFVLHGVLVLQRADTDHPLEALRLLQKQLRQIPNEGLGYSLLARFGTIDQKQSLSPLTPELVFNYLGQTGFPSVDTPSVLRRAQEFAGNVENPRNRFWCLLESMVFLAQSCLTMRWKYSETVYESTTIKNVSENFTETLRALIMVCQQ